MSLGRSMMGMFNALGFSVALATFFITDHYMWLGTAAAFGIGWMVAML